MTALAADFDLEALWSLTRDGAESCVWTDDDGAECRLEARWVALWSGDCRCPWTARSFLCDGHRDGLLAIAAEHGRRLGCRECHALVVLVRIEAIR